MVLHDKRVNARGTLLRGYSIDLFVIPHTYSYKEMIYCTNVQRLENIKEILTQAKRVYRATVRVGHGPRKTEETNEFNKLTKAHARNAPHLTAG